MGAVLSSPLEMIAALVAMDTRSSLDPRIDQSNVEVSELVRSWLDALGFRTRLVPVDDACRKVNVVGVLGEGDGGLALAGHLDTVPADPQLWKSDPWRADIRDGRVYGLGTSDMKSFLALAAHAASRIDTTKLRAPITIVGTADEECTMAGAKALVREGAIESRACVIGEPTGMRAVRKHKGVVMDRVRIQGKSGHSSDPSLGANAIEGMMVVLAELDRFRKELATRYRDEEFSVPYPTMNFGVIHGGDNPNRICGACELEIDVRLLPSMRAEDVRAEITSRLGALSLPAGLTVEHTPVSSGTRPFETRGDAELVRAIEALTSTTATSALFGTEGPHFTALGAETVVFGPGDIETAHQPDEHLRLDRIEPAIDVLVSLIDKYCVAEQHTPERGRARGAS